MASNFKVFFLFSFLLLAMVVGYFWFDDSLNPKAEYWIKHYQAEVNTDNNAFIYLIGLNNQNNNDPLRSGLSKYQKQVDRYQGSFIDLTKKLSYPDPQILPEAETDPLLCDLSEQECMSLLHENKEDVEALVTYYQPLLTQFHHMASLSNFSFINTELTHRFTVGRQRSEVLRHVLLIARSFQERSDEMAAALDRYLPGSYKQPSGGSSYWCQVPDHIDTAVLKQRAAERGLLIISCDSYHFGSHLPKNFIKLGFSAIDTTAIEPGIKILAELIGEMECQSGLQEQH